MRTYSFDHFLTDKPEPGVTNPGGAKQIPPVEQTRPTVPPSEEKQLHYGRQHARTAELYQKHREEREHAQQLGATEAEQEPLGGEAPPREAREEPVIHGKEDVVQHAGSMPEEAERENLRDLAHQAVSSVLQAAREAAKGRPLVGAKKLAGDAVSGVFRVARQVSARAARSSTNKKKGGSKAKGPGKKR
jgi:hypothetical protein